MCVVFFPAISTFNARRYFISLSLSATRFSISFDLIRVVHCTIHTEKPTQTFTSQIQWISESVPRLNFAISLDALLLACLENLLQLQIANKKKKQQHKKHKIHNDNDNDDDGRPERFRLRSRLKYDHHKYTLHYLHAFVVELTWTHIAN